MKNIAIIPARGGSKRIPFKNIKAFLGKPILAYSIETALQSNLFQEVMVSTDDEQIAEIALQYGAKVTFLRSDKTANDYAGIADVIIEVLEAYQKRHMRFDALCCLLATAPLIQADDLKNTYKILQTTEYTSICPIVAFSYPVLRSLTLNKEKRLERCWPEFADTRSQDMETFYHDAGAFYWSTQEAFLRYKRFISPNCGAYIMDELKVNDIDNETDWKLAELKYKLIHNC